MGGQEGAEGDEEYWECDWGEDAWQAGWRYGGGGGFRSHLAGNAAVRDRGGGDGERCFRLVIPSGGKTTADGEDLFLWHAFCDLMTLAGSICLVYLVFVPPRDGFLKHIDRRRTPTMNTGASIP